MAATFFITIVKAFIDVIFLVFVALGGSLGYLTVPGSKLEDWLAAGQCNDCYMPAYNYRPGGSVQYALALRDFDGKTPKRFRFGMIASSDVHTARPGTGYKEIHRRLTTDAALGLLGPPAILRAAEPAPRSIPPEEVTDFGPYFERFASFFCGGGLVAAHSEGRDTPPTQSLAVRSRNSRHIAGHLAFAFTPTIGKLDDE